MLAYRRGGLAGRAELIALIAISFRDGRDTFCSTNKSRVLGEIGR